MEVPCLFTEVDFGPKEEEGKEVWPQILNQHEASSEHRGLFISQESQDKAAQMEIRLRNMQSEVLNRESSFKNSHTAEP